LVQIKIVKFKIIQIKKHFDFNQDFKQEIYD